MEPTIISIAVSTVVTPIVNKIFNAIFGGENHDSVSLRDYLDKISKEFSSVVDLVIRNHFFENSFDTIKAHTVTSYEKFERFTVTKDFSLLNDAISDLEAAKARLMIVIEKLLNRDHEQNPYLKKMENRAVCQRLLSISFELMRGIVAIDLKLSSHYLDYHANYYSIFIHRHHMMMQAMNNTIDGINLMRISAVMVYGEFSNDERESLRKADSDGYMKLFEYAQSVINRHKASILLNRQLRAVLHYGKHLDKWFSYPLFKIDNQLAVTVHSIPSLGVGGDEIKYQVHDQHFHIKSDVAQNNYMALEDKIIEILKHREDCPCKNGIDSLTEDSRQALSAIASTQNFNYIINCINYSATSAQCASNDMLTAYSALQVEDRDLLLKKLNENGLTQWTAYFNQPEHYCISPLGLPGACAMSTDFSQEKHFSPMLLMTGILWLAHIINSTMNYSKHQAHSYRNYSLSGFMRAACVFAAVLLFVTSFDCKMNQSLNSSGFKP